MSETRKEEIVLKGYHWSQGFFEGMPQDGIVYLALNMTSVCNYRCPYCFVGLENLKVSRNEMTVEEKVRIIREAKDCSARVVSMPGRGEPLADSGFWDILDAANRLGLWVVVYTNGYFLDREKIEQLKDKPISLYIKVDSFDRDIYEKMVGKSGVYERMRQNLDMLVQNFNEPEEDGRQIISRLGINSVVTAYSAGSIPELYEWCRQRGIYYTCRSPVKVGEAALTWDYLVQGRSEELRDVGRKYAARNFTSATELGQCGIYRFGITVDNNGEVLVCPDAHSGFRRIGNIRELSLKDLIKQRNKIYPLNSSPGYCFVRARNKQLDTSRKSGKLARIINF